MPLFLFLNFLLILLIFAAIAQIFNPIAELGVSIGIRSKEIKQKFKYIQ